MDADLDVSCDVTLAGFICDRRIAREVFPNGVPSGVVPNAIHAVCVDWSCRR